MKQLLTPKALNKLAQGRAKRRKSRGAALGYDVFTIVGREFDFPINRRVAETETSRGWFRPRRNAG